MKFKNFLIIVMLALIRVNAYAQNIQQYPRLNLTFNGSSTSETLNLGGWTRIRTSLVTPAVSTSGELRWYFNGTNLLISENGGAYRIVGSGNGTVTSVAIAAPAAVFAVSGSPVTGAGTLTLSYQTQTANTVFAGPTTGGATTPTFRGLVAADIPALSYVSTTATQAANAFLVGPTTGAAAAPTWRTMVLADVPDGLITFAKWSAQCAANEIPKRNAGNTAWVCGVDNTSPGGTAWVTAGNTSVTGGILGTTDAQAFTIRSNNVVKANVSLTGFEFIQPTVVSPQADAFATAGTTFVDSTTLTFRARRWTGAASADQDYTIFNDQTSATAGANQLTFNYAGSFVAGLDSGGNWNVSGSLTAAGIIGGNGYFSNNARSSPGVSSGTTGRIYFDSGQNRYLISENGSGYQTLTGQGPTNWCTWAPNQAEYPSTAPAVAGTLANRAYVGFTDGAALDAFFTCTLPSTYDGSNFNIDVRFTTASATGNIVMAVAIEKETSTISMADTYGVTAGNGNTLTQVTFATTATINVLKTQTFTYTAANAASPAANDIIRLRVQRVGNSGSDTNGDAVRVFGITLRK